MKRLISIDLKNSCRIAKSRILFKFPAVLKLLIFLVTSFFASNSFAQNPPACSQNCSAKDIKVQSIELVTYNGTGDAEDPDSYSSLPATCNQNQQITGYLKVNLNVTAATRYTFLIAGELWVDNVHITASDPNQCFPNTLAKGNHSIIITNDPIVWTCGSKIEIWQAFTAWGNSSSDNVCSFNCTQISSHCKKYGLTETFTVITSLSAKFTWTANCVGGNNERIYFDASTSSGGLEPYKSYQWDFDNDGIFDQQSLTPTTTYDFASAGTYTVRLRVTAANDATNDYFEDVEVAACCTSPTIATNPSSVTKCTGTSASFTASANGGNPTPSVKWQISTNNGGSWTDLNISEVYTNTTSTTLEISDVTGLNGSQYRAVFTSGTCTPANSTGAILTVSETPTTATAGADQTQCETATATLAGNTATVGAGEWTLVSGAGTVTTPSSPTSGVMGLGYGANVFKWTISNGTCTASEDEVTITRYQAPTTATVSNTQNICGSLTSNALGGNTPIVGQGAWSKFSGPGTVSFSDGASGASTATASAYGTYVLRWTVSNGTCAASTADVTVNYNQIGICPSYTGDYFFNVDPATSIATVTLTYNITGTGNCYDISSLQPTDFVSAPFAKDNTLGTITQISGTGNYNAITKVYTLTYVYSVPLPSSKDYSGTVQFSLSTQNNSNYLIGKLCNEQPLITVSRVVDGFVTGGGYVLQDANTRGTKGGVGNNGYKANFGFNVKSNKGSGNYQGSWNTIFRRMEGSVVRTYQVRSVQPSKLVISQISATSYRADFTFTGANLKDLTTNSSTIASNLTVNVTVYDNGEPGFGVDKIYYEVKDGNTLLYATGPAATYSTLSKGNIQVHTSGAKAGSQRTVDPAITSIAPENFNLKVLPNPSSSYFAVNITGNSTEKMQVRVMDIMGRNIETLANIAPNQTIRLGTQYRPGLYFVELTQGNKKQQVKLIKQ